MKNVSVDEYLRGETSPLLGEVRIHGDSGLETAAQIAINNGLDEREPGRDARNSPYRVSEVEVTYPESGGVKAIARRTDGTTVAFKLYYGRPGVWSWEYPLA